MQLFASGVPHGEWASGKWWTVLEAPWSSNPEVVIVMAPQGSKGTIEETNDGKYSLGVLISPRGTRRCLQVITPPEGTWPEHEAIAEHYGLEMAGPEHVGLLSEVPNKLLLASVRFPIVFLRDAMWLPPLNLKNFMRECTRKVDDDN